MAELDLTRRNITSIRGLGYKQWGSLDASDKDGGKLGYKQWDSLDVSDREGGKLGYKQWGSLDASEKTETVVSWATSSGTVWTLVKKR